MAESMQGLKRSHRCGELSRSRYRKDSYHYGMGAETRNKGGLVFVDVRDRSGIIQVVFEEGKADKALLDKAAGLRAEYVVAIVGTVRDVRVQSMKISLQGRSRSSLMNYASYQSLRHRRSQLKKMQRQGKKCA